MSGLIKHSSVCSARIRGEKEKEPNSQLAFLLWKESFRKTSRKNYEFNTFIAHRDYNFFIRIADFCLKLNISEPTKYMNWCIGNRLKFPMWTSELSYENFVKHSLVHELPADAVIRSLNFINTVFDGQINVFFDTIKPGVFLNMIEMGRISPWLLVLHRGFYKLKKRFNSDQLQKFNNIVDETIWNILKRRHEETCKEISKVLLTEQN